jgi:hypothetical protein
MNRWLLAMAVLLGGALSVAHADYLRIIYNLAAQADPNQAQPGAAAPAPPGARPGPVPGPPGGKPGPGGPPAPGNPAPPPGGRPGGPGQNPPRPGNPLERLLRAAQDDEDNLAEAEVVVEFNNTDPANMVGEGGVRVAYPRIQHKWGKTPLILTLPDIKVEFVTEEGVKVPTVAQRYKSMRDAKLKDGKNAENLLELAEWVLAHANISDTRERTLTEFAKVMGELREVNPSHPVVKAFDQVQSDLDRGAAKEGAAATWKDRLGGYKLKDSKHYTMLFDSPEGDPAEVSTYLNELEENMRGFYYWFALKGRVLPVPERRLLAVLVNKPEQFHSYRHAFDDAPLVQDGFFARRENLAFFCATRQDEVYNLLVKHTGPLWQTGWNMDDLLKGKGHANARSADESVKNSMLALLQKAMEEESSRASVSHVGTRQLLVAAGLLTPRVEAPEWVQFGAASFFETPTGAYWPGIGAPSWKYLVKYKLWRQADRDAQQAEEEARKARRPVVVAERKLERSDEAIRRVITDRYFREARDELKKGPELKARTMAWGLAYFLMNRHLDGFLRYCEELAQLPRDMVPDDDTLVMCFARAFDMVDPTDPYRPNETKLNSFADEWYSFLDLKQMESSEALQDAFKQAQRGNKRKARATPAPKSPGNPAAPAPGGKTNPPGGKPPSAGGAG